VGRVSMDLIVADVTDLPLRIEGLYTHLACSDDPAVPFTRIQLERFAEARAALTLSHLPRPLIHVASSAGLLTRAERDVDLVRPGLALYGLNPFGNLPAPELTAAMTVSTRLNRVERFPAGTAVGYGSTYITLRDATLATLPIGYDDGLSRALSDDWEIVVRDRLVPLVGRVSMDLIVADVTDLPDVKVGDEAILMGGGPGCPAHSAESMASRLKTIPYEITSSFGGRLPRVFSAADEVVAIQSRFGSLGLGFDDVTTSSETPATTDNTVSN
ncbi:MAG: alanine racemase, partial [Acidobacteriota bacterium]